MREDIKKWVEALRSGKYKQTEGVLKKPESDGFSYCCGGVYAELCGQNPPVASEWGDKWVDEYGSDEVYYWWDEEVGDERVNHYMDMNDNGSTFEEIADQIEEDWDNGLIKNDVHA